MLKKSCRIIISIVLLLFSSVSAGDLYLLDINSSSELDIVNNVLEFAHGGIDGKFIVNLDAKQARLLNSSFISMELIKRDADLSEFYLTSRIHSAIDKSILMFQPEYASESEYLIKASQSTLDVIQREGYMSIPIERLETPFFYFPTSYSVSSIESMPSDTLADLVIQDSLYSYDIRLEAFQTRYIYTDSIHSARDWLVAKFESFGYTNVTTEMFYYNGLPCYNVKCFKMGTTEADKLVVIGGHYDSINFENEGNGMTFAPGADDNASGTATVLEMARVFSQIDTKKSYYFCAFSAEEVGLVGAYDMAGDFASSGANIECMLNFDMVAYTENEYDDIELGSGLNRVYADVLMDAATRVTDLIPVFVGNQGSSDYRAFDNNGFLVGNVIEADFNYPGWHTNLDLSSRLDFPYFEQVVRMGVAAVGHIDNAAHSSPIEDVYDIGDGQSVSIVWENCDPTYSYSVLMGTSSGNYEDTIVMGTVPPCEYDITGLTEGQTYFFAVLGENSEGFGPLYVEESEGESYVIPRPPQGVSADIDLNKISLEWLHNNEIDFSHYEILRRPIGMDWEVIESSFTDHIYEDNSVAAHVEYEYRILAVDNDMNYSDSSDIVSATAATFDLQILFVDETSSGGLNPSTSEQEEFYQNGLFNGYGATTFHAESSPDILTRSLSGQHKSLFWFDDDISPQVFIDSKDTVDWFLDYNTNVCLAGWQTVFWVTGMNPLPVGSFFRERFGLSQVTDNSDFDFIGAFGQNGWPDIQTTTDNAFSGLLPNVPKFDVFPGAEVILTYNSNSDNPDFEGEPCGVLYDNGKNKAIVFAFPIIQLELESAQALMAKIIETFGIEIVLMNGDANNDGGLNLLDITYLISYIYKGGPPPPIMNQADADGNCTLSLLDITYLIAYLYKGGPEPIDGCVD